MKEISNLQIIKNIYKKEGIKSFWRSFPVNFVGNLPNAMITVTMNENLKNLHVRHIGELKMSSYFLCAGLAGLISSIITTPLDNIKTRLNV